MTALDIIRIYENLVLAVDSGDPSKNLELIQAVTVAVFDIVNDQDFSEDFAKRYGQEILKQLVMLTVPT